MILSLSLCSCATRSAKVVLGADWPDAEPVVNLDAYESVQRRPGQRSDIAVAVAISGGGMRAGNFAAGVLKALESIQVPGAGGSRSNLLREVDYFSTVSGGGMAAGSYMTHLLEYRRQHPEDASASGFSFSKREYPGKEGGGRSWREALAQNYQSSLVGSFFNPLMITQLDRGDILEGRLDEKVLGLHDGKSLTLRDVFVPKGGGAPQVPYWIANGTVYENGAIFPFTPDILATYQINGYKHRLRSGRLDDPYDMPLAVGLKTSASFPVAIPASTLKSGRDPKNPRLHLLDGGVADNLGIITALRLLRQDKAAQKVLIVIDAYNGKTEPYSKAGNRPGSILTALRTTSISLDSSHQRVRSLLGIVGAQSGVRHAVIDFHQAVRKQAATDAVAAAGSAATDASATSPDASSTADSENETDMSPQSVQAVFTQALGVGTWFKISDKAQEVLLTAGRNAIYRHDEATGAHGSKLLPEVQSIRNLF
ncbi:MAG: patatin-like phospholipase family protein [Verrucomicrobiaceae bacterium]|nr:patatin-like phospholipase family protein [Verrucomicrobiaceae bacterium]